MDASDVVLPTFLILLFNTNLFINSQGVTYGVNLEEKKKKPLHLNLLLTHMDLQV